VGVIGARERVNALEQTVNEQGRGGGVQTLDDKFWRSTTAPHFTPFQGFFGNNDPIQIAPKLSATVT